MMARVPEMKKLIYVGIFVVGLLIIHPSSYGQLKQDYEYSSEVIWGINKNTNGGLIGGFMLKFGRERSEGLFESYGIELSNVKHPKEQRTQTNSGSTYIWGKQNYLYAIRLQYGREKILFKKAPQQGVQINAILAAGPTIGLLTPYYVAVASQNSQETVTVPFDPNLHSSQRVIIGTGGIFQGLGESSVKIGANVKTSLSFEFGTYKRHVTGFEVGFMLEAYTEEIVIMPNTDNRSIFPSAFVTLFYGARK